MAFRHPALAAVCAWFSVGSIASVDIQMCERLNQTDRDLPAYQCKVSDVTPFSGAPFKIKTTTTDSFRFLYQPRGGGMTLDLHYGGGTYQVAPNEALVCFPPSKLAWMILTAVSNDTSVASADLSFDVDLHLEKPVPMMDLNEAYTIYGDQILVPLEAEDTRDLKRFHVNISRNHNGTARMYLFSDSTSCIKPLIAKGGCIQWTPLISCLVGDQANPERSSARMSESVEQHTTMTLTKGSLKAESKAISPRRWYLVVDFSAFGSQQPEDLPGPSDHTLPDAPLGFNSTGTLRLKIDSESNIPLRLFIGSLFMLLVPIGALAGFDFLQWLLKGVCMVQSSSHSVSRCSRAGLHLFKEDLGNFCHSFYKLRLFEASFPGLLCLAGVSFFVATTQFVGARWSQLYKSGNHDFCYYNEKCYYPIGGWDLPFNNMLSHISYFTCASYVFFSIARLEMTWSRLSPRFKLDMRVFRSLALAIALEGVGSMCYHVCPGNSVFQFDTAMMLPICHLSMLALVNTDPASQSDTQPDGDEYLERIPREHTMGLRETVAQRLSQTRHLGGKINEEQLLMPVVRRRVPPLGYCLCVLCPLWFLNYLGTCVDFSSQKRETSGALNVVFALLVALWAVFALSVLNRPFPQRDVMSIWMLRILVIGVLATALVSRKTRVYAGGITNVFLLLSIFSMLFITFRQVILFDLALHPLRSVGSVVSLIFKYSVSLTFMAVALVAFEFYTTHVMDVAQSAAQSRELNRPCVVSIFDHHDLWHLLSAISLALWVQMLLEVKFRIAKRAYGIHVADRNEMGVSLAQTEAWRAGNASVSTALLAPGTFTGTGTLVGVPPLESLKRSGPVSAVQAPMSAELIRDEHFRSVVERLESMPRTQSALLA